MIFPLKNTMRTDNHHHHNNDTYEARASKKGRVFCVKINVRDDITNQNIPKLSHDIIQGPC